MHARVDLDCGRLDVLRLHRSVRAARRRPRGKGRRDAELRLCAVPHPLARLLRLSRTAGVFTIEPEPAG